MSTEKNAESRTIPFVTEDGTTVSFCVLEQTKFYGINYLLVTEDDTLQDAEVYILKDLSGEESAQAVYEIVDDTEELHAVAGLFEELLEDVEIIEENE